MLRNYFRSIVGNISRNILIVCINVAGFSIAMACCIFIALFVADEVSYDKQNVNIDRIYRVALDRIYPDRNVEWARIAPGVKDGLVNDIPEIEEATRVRHGDFTVSVQKIKSFEEKVIQVDPSFFKIFTVDFLKGSSSAALNDPNSVVLSSKAARKLFPDEDAIGKEVNIETLGVFHVTGVFADIPEAAHFHYDFVMNLSFDKVTDFNVWDNNFGFCTYFLTREKVSLENIDTKLASMSKKYLSKSDADTYAKWRKEGNDYRFFVQPLADIHLKSDLKWEVEVNGNQAYVYIFIGVGLLILVIAVINFVNLSTARYATRAKEVGIRKILGSQRRQLIFQFLIESLTLSSIAIIFSLLLFQLALPFLNDLLGKHFYLPYFSNALAIPLLILLMLMLGFVSGIYPAILISSFQPVQVLSTGRASSTSRSVFRNRLVILQFAISFFLLTSTFIIFSQIRFMKNKNLGISKENIIVIDKAGEIKNRDAFKNELAARKEVLSVAASSSIPGNIEGATTFRPKGVNNETELNVSIMAIDQDVIATWELDVKAGRGFVESDFGDTNRYVLLNETAVKQFGWTDDPIGKELLDGNDRITRVLGVVNDFHLESLRKEIRPLVILPNKNWSSYISIRVAEQDLPQTIAYAEQQWRTMVPEKPFKYFFLEDFYKQLYKSDDTTVKLFILLSGLAIFIGCLGLFGLSTFTAQQRTKEIGIRKVLGSTALGIMFLLIKDLSKLVLIATVIGIPLTWCGSHYWLENFAYRVDVTIIPFLVSATISFMIAIVTIAFHAYRASVVNPTVSLRA
jgi:putative ABC transport system permease protein